MAAKIPAFTEEELSIDEALAYPKAYSNLCNPTTLRTCITPYLHGPPLSFLPYTLHPHEALRAKDLNQMFPVIDPDAKPSANPRGYVNLLWKQLDHLGNAGFDPALFRVDPFGNVLYLHADSASPLAWDIDHWFPCSRGGRTVPSNLRLLQWQLCKKKKGKLEFLVPWWDLQLGISVTQFLSIFASKNSGFRNRAFSFLFSDGGSEELNSLQTVDSHSLPHHYIEMEQQVGLAPAALVSTHRLSDSSSVLKPLDINRSHRPSSPFPGTSLQRLKSNVSKENEQPETDDYATNPYLSIARARDSLKQREESKKQQAEISQLEDELNEQKENNEVERVALQDLEAVLIKKRRRVEKCRRLAEAQSSYKSSLEKMIRDSMHQSVVYKEQLRLNQAATSSLMARLEAQRAICDAFENELRRKFKQRDEIEKTMRPCWGEHTRKRSRLDHTLFEERNEDCIKAWTPPKKELRVFLEEEQKASEAGLSLLGEEEEKEEEEEEEEDKGKALVLANNEITKNNEDLVESKLRQLAIREGDCSKTNVVSLNESKDSCEEEEEDEDEEEHRNRIGKGNVEKWLELMMENAKGGRGSSSTSQSPDTAENGTAETVSKLNQMNPEKEIKYLRLKPLGESSGVVSSSKAMGVRVTEGFDHCRRLHQ